MKHYIGVDVSKLSLDVYVEQKVINFSNDNKGIKKLINKIKKIYDNQDDCLVVYEPTGGYEYLLKILLNEANIPICMVHANKIRAFAKASGILAKTDKVDAKVITSYAEKMSLFTEKITCSKEEEKIRLLVKRRDQLLNDKKREENRLDKEGIREVKKSIKDHIKWLEKQIEKINEQLDLCNKENSVKEKYELLISIPSIGAITAYTLIAYLPELGILSHKKIAALVGVAPYNKDSGKYSGKRFIQGGRNIIRKILYMCAVSSIRCNKDMKKFYDSLKERGKPSKLALTAVMRKLLSVINSVVHRKTAWVEKIA